MADQLRKFRTSDGYVFYLQPDGRVTDDPDPEKGSDSYDSFDLFVQANENDILEITSE